MMFVVITEAGGVHSVTLMVKETKLNYTTYKM
jgi:hypothetical protein